MTFFKIFFCKGPNLLTVFQLKLHFRLESFYNKYTMLVHRISIWLLIKQPNALLLTQMTQNDIKPVIFFNIRELWDLETFGIIFFFKHLPNDWCFYKGKQLPRIWFVKKYQKKPCCNKLVLFFSQCPKNCCFVTLIQGLLEATGSTHVTGADIRSARTSVRSNHYQYFFTI
jgi:hypothetical protein